MVPPTALFEEEPATTREAIMEATYVALAKHGYADLTIQRISDEFDKSKSLLYHHYDSKDALLVDFLEFMLRHIEADLPLGEQSNAYEQLMLAFDHVFGELCADVEFLRALAELRAQGATDERYREQFTANDQFVQRHLVEIIETGIAKGTFRDVDATRTAELLGTMIDGIILRTATIDDIDHEVIRTEIDEYVRDQLVADDAQV